jgi:uncharacterized protein YjeT (DUF2065 family)
VWQDFAVACCLLLVLEGLLPFLSPRAWRHMVETASRMDDRSLRAAGFGSMIAGTLLLYLVH